MKKLVLIACAIACLIISARADNQPIGRYQLITGRALKEYATGGGESVILKIDTATGYTWILSNNKWVRLTGDSLTGDGH